MTSLNFDADTTFHAGFVLPDLRNGPPDTITEVMPRGSIPAMYRWMGIRGLPADQWVSRLEVVARITYAYMRVQDPAMDIAAARDQAIALASIRVGAIAAFTLTGADLSADEVGPGVATYRAPVTAVAAVGAVGDVGYVAPVAAVPEGVTLVWGGGTTAGATTAWNAWAPMTDLERAVATHHVILSMPILPTHGWSIVKCGHHFLSNPAQRMRSAWDGIKKQWMGKIPPSVATWVQGRIGWWEDVVFHKALHPVRMSLPVSFAQSTLVKERLVAVGWGAAAVRLPVTDPAFEIVKVAIALAAKTETVLTLMGGSVDVTRLQAYVNDVVAAADATIRNRLVNEAVLIVTTKAAQVAYLAGLYDALVTASYGPPPTLLNSIGLKKLVQDNPAGAAQGASIYRAFAARERKALEEGTSTAAKLVF